MKFIRSILGAIVVFFDAITRPKPMTRSEHDQAHVNEEAKKLVLYQFHGCPFCVKVRRALHKLNVSIELRDAQKEEFAQQLVEGGGRRKVPCLRIEEDGDVRWMYESNDIIAYLNKLFGI